MITYDEIEQAAKRKIKNIFKGNISEEEEQYYFETCNHFIYESLQFENYTKERCLCKK